MNSKYNLDEKNNIELLVLYKQCREKLIDSENRIEKLLEYKHKWETVLKDMNDIKYGNLLKVQYENKKEKSGKLFIIKTDTKNSQYMKLRKLQMLTRNLIKEILAKRR